MAVPKFLNTVTRGFAGQAAANLLGQPDTVAYAHHIHVLAGPPEGQVAHETTNNIGRIPQLAGRSGNGLKQGQIGQARVFHAPKVVRPRFTGPQKKLPRNQSRGAFG